MLVVSLVGLCVVVSIFAFIMAKSNRNRVVCFPADYSKNAEMKKLIQNFGLVKVFDIYNIEDKEIPPSCWVITDPTGQFVIRYSNGYWMEYQSIDTPKETLKRLEEEQKKFLENSLKIHQTHPLLRGWMKKKLNMYGVEPYRVRK